MSPTTPSSVRRHHRLIAVVCGFVASGLLAGGCGTTEARSNDELEPGSGELGSGDAAEVSDELDAEAEPEEEADVEAEPTPTTLVAGVGAPCETREAKSEIRALPARVFDYGVDLETRLTAVQLGTDPEVVAQARTHNERERAAGVEVATTFTQVSNLTCIDDGSAMLEITRRRGDRSGTIEGSAMLVDGSWKLTLFTLCLWNTRAPCTEVDGLQDRATGALSPALREALDR